MTIDLENLADHLDEIVERLDAGEEVLVTRSSRVVAELIPPDEPIEDADGGDAIERLRALPPINMGRVLTADDVKALIDEGRGV